MKYISFHNYLLETFPTGATILEFGSGVGTCILAEKFNMISIEHDFEWLNYSKDSTYVYAPIVDGWYDMDKIKKGIEKVTYDVVLVDGPTGKIGRKGLLDNLKFFDIKVPWVFDDVQRSNEKQILLSFLKEVNRSCEVYKGENKSFAVV